MPHVIVKMHKGRSEELKKQLADEIAKVIQSVLKSEDRTISVGVEDFEKDVWPEEVYKPDILNKANSLYKKPGYNPFS